MLKQVEAGVLSVAYEESGAADGMPVLLLHGFPYDVHVYDDVTPLLVAAGCRVIAPYLRGYGPTRFLSADTPRSGQQAVLGHDLVAFMDALEIQSGVLAGYDWGGCAACIVAALWPERVSGLAWNRIGANCANSSGSYGPLAGISTRRRTTALQPLSTTRTSSPWSFIPTAIDSRWCLGTRRSKRPSAAWPSGRRSRCHRSCCTAAIPDSSHRWPAPSVTSSSSRALVYAG